MNGVNWPESTLNTKRAGKRRVCEIHSQQQPPFILFYFIFKQMRIQRKFKTNTAGGGFVHRNLKKCVAFNFIVLKNPLYARLWRTM